MKTIEVVAAIIRKGDKIFATQRGYGDYKDWWVFPGGKHRLAEKVRRRPQGVQRIRRLAPTSALQQVEGHEVFQRQAFKDSVK